MIQVTALALLALIAPLAAAVETATGRVVGISDGDTITVLISEQESPYRAKVRLAGIDAPEKAQPFGQRSKQNLSDLVFGKNVVLDCSGTDRYHRAICVVLVDGRDANLAQIEAGMAWWYHKYANTQTPARRTAYQVAETTAQADRRGLWVEPRPTPPWEWRHR